MLRVDAAPFWARLEATSMKDGKGEYLCRIVISDITKHKQVENALGESEKLYHSLFEHMLNGLAYCRMHFDDKGRPYDFTYLSVNNAFETYGRIMGAG